MVLAGATTYSIPPTSTALVETMIYVYRGSSKSATGLSDMIREEGAQVTRLHDLTAARPRATDLVVNWGAYVRFHGWTNIRILNRRIIGDKLEELRMLDNNHVLTPEFRVTRPVTGRWIARLREHYEANDVRQELTVGDYYTRFYDVREEFRFHIFAGRCIKKQVKEAENARAHPWIRSSASGWEWYNTTNDPSAMRESAIRAVAALRYDFGAVDVGRCRDGSHIVFEVNSGPGIDPGGNTVRQYARAIIALAKEIA